MSKGASFAQGFADAFVPIYTAGMQAKQKAEQDKIRIGAQTWLDQKSTYDSAKQKDEALWSQAESLVASETNVPEDATTTVFNMLKGGRSVDAIIKDVRAVGAKFEAIAPPVMGEDPVLPTVEDQSNDLFEVPEIGAEATTPEDKPNLFEKIGDRVGNVFGKDKKPESDNPFDQYKTEIQEYVGEDTEYFDQVISGYQAPERKSNYTFVPGVTKVSVTSLDDAYVASIQNSQEYTDAVKAGDVALQQKILLTAMQDKTNGSKNQFGTGTTAVVMGVWAETPEGKAALESGDPMAIAKQINIFESVINPDKTDKKAFDLDNLDASFFAIWENSPEGMQAIADSDTNAINLAIAASAEQGNTARNAINAGYGFKPEDVTELKQVPGLLEQYKNYPVVVDQIVGIRDSLRAQETESQTAVPKRVYGVGPDGETVFVGTGNYKGGRLYMPDPQNPEKEVAVPIATAAQYQLTDTDQPIDILKWNINEINKKKNTLTGTVDFASDALNYISGLQNNPLSRTRVARLTSGASELLDELKAIKEISSIVNPDGSGEMLIDQDRMLREIQNNVSLNKFSSGVRSVIAQETSLIFSIARAEGNSGTALSNKDYDNYFKSIFNSNDPKVIEQNILRKVGQSYNSALAGAKSVGSMQGMEFVTEGNGGRWWANAEEFAVDGRSNPVRNFLNQAVKTVSDIQESSTYKTTAKQLLDIYQSGGSITVTEELANTYPSLRGKAGQTIQKTPKGANNGE